ncbi:hypothetical protein NLN78_23295, partial [Citrobacter portucalensis]|nr:hypothetical protein [Citrobacter portucalensis]
WWLTPEFICSAWGLGVFTSAFLVEEIASGLQAVSAGQREAAVEGENNIRAGVKYRLNEDHKFVEC